VVIQGQASETDWQAAGGHGPSVLIDQAMQMLGVSRRTVYYWIRQGRLQTFRTRCGSQRVLLSSMSRPRPARQAGASQAVSLASALTSAAPGVLGSHGDFDS
jgi:excisionase family DNA binding protein